MNEVELVRHTVVRVEEQSIPLPETEQGLETRPRPILGHLLQCEVQGRHLCDHGHALHP